MAWYYVLAFLLGGLVVGLIVAVLLLNAIGTVLLDILVRNRR